MLELTLPPVKPPSANYRKAESARNESIESNHISITSSFGGLPPAESIRCEWKTHFSCRFHIAPELDASSVAYMLASLGQRLN